MTDSPRLMYWHFYGLLTADTGFKYIISSSIVCHFKTTTPLLCLLLRGASGINRKEDMLIIYILAVILLFVILPISRPCPSFCSVFPHQIGFPSAFSWAIYPEIYWNIFNSRSLQKRPSFLHSYYIRITVYASRERWGYTLRWTQICG